jgi:hypothetical protein
VPSARISNPPTPVHSVPLPDHGVNPRDVEYGPNPVIDAHFATDPCPGGAYELQHRVAATSHFATHEPASCLEGSASPFIVLCSSSDSTSATRSSHASPSSAQLSSASRTTSPSTAELDPAPSKHYQCAHCDMLFDTNGQVNNHNNRKHNLRFKCSIAGCNSTFGLSADLKRHQHTVHKDAFTPIPAKVFKCDNVGCTGPGKIYVRKDNFKRHVKRCKKVIARADASAGTWVPVAR